MKNKFLISIISLVITVVMLPQLFAQSDNGKVLINASFAKDTIMIGDQILLSVTVERDIMQETLFPKLDNGLGGVIEILGEGPVDTVARDGRTIKLKKDYLVTSFDAGNYNIGLFPVMRKEVNRIDTLFSQDSIKLFVNTFEIDSTKHKIIDITEPLDTPLLFVEVQNYVYIGLLVLVLLIVLFFLYRKYKDRLFGKKVIVPSLPPHLLAMQGLESIFAKKLWQEGKQKEYYTTISDILREYIDSRYGVNAMEMTTDEILLELVKVDISPKNVDALKEVLSLSDLVKFAKFSPDSHECEQSFAQSYKFVEQTKPILVEVDTKDSDTATDNHSEDIVKE